MSFISVSFLVFVPLVFALYWGVGPSARRQNAVLVVASLVFYGWADWRFVFLLLFSALVSWGCGKRLSRGLSVASARAVAGLGIVLNLAVLVVFKYYDFFVLSFTQLFSSLGFTVHWPLLNVALPIGISFFTFQAVAYIVDVRRGKALAAENLVDYLAFLCFFPQLVAGPIERAGHLLAQMRRRRLFNARLATDGMRQLLWGLAKKVIVADNCGLMVDQTWHDVATASSLQLWMGAILFTIQIYADFSGYCDMALGCAKLFGIRLSRNFLNPFFSRDMGEVWRRWHVSLMQWFRDYVYIPLGGSRHGEWRRLANVLIVFALSGLWHGAAWTFMAWGLFNGILVVLWNKRHRAVDVPERLSASMALAFLLFAVGFVFFRAPDLTSAGTYLSGMFTRRLSVPYGWHALAYGAAMLVVEWLMRRREHGLQWSGTGLLRLRAVRWTVYYLLFAAVVVMLLSAERVAFIYFRF